MTVLRSGSATDVGLVRASNQDVALESGDLFAVADGMGGHAGGEVAARVAVESLQSSFERQPSVEGLRRAVAEANRAVWRESQADPALRGMGTTLTATALVRDDGGRQVIALANVGDSRAYVWSKGQVTQITSDHSLAEEKVRLGEMSEAEAAVHPHRHILTRALGVSTDVDVDLWELHLYDGDRILLCSDGLTNEVNDALIGETLAAVSDPGDAARVLVRTALEHGGNDNITVVVVNIATAGAAPGPAAAAPEVATAGSADQDSPATDPGRPSASAAALGLAAGSGAAAAAATASLPIGGAAGVAPTAGIQPPPASPTTPSGSSVPISSSASSPQSTSAPLTGVVQMTGGSVQQPAVLLPPPTTAVPSVGRDRGPQAVPPRKRPTRRERRRQRRLAGIPRMFTLRVALFLVFVAAVVVAAYGLVRWYATDEWYVGVDNHHLAVYHGRPGGFLWYHPARAEVTSATTANIPAYRWSALSAHVQVEPSLAAARRYVANLKAEYRTTQTLGVDKTTIPVTTTTTAPSQGATTTTIPTASTTTTTNAAAAAKPATRVRPQALGDPTALRAN